MYDAVLDVVNWHGVSAVDNSSVPPAWVTLLSIHMQTQRGHHHAPRVFTHAWKKKAMHLTDIVHLLHTSCMHTSLDTMCTVCTYVYQTNKVVLTVVHV